MDILNIFDLANQNSDNLKQCFCSLKENCIDSNELNKLDKFYEVIRNEWTISINMGQIAINNFLIAGKYKNIYVLKNDQEKALRNEMVELNISLEQALERHLKSYYEPRVIIFDSMFENGTEFNYAALNIGGLGVKKYGEYCVIIKREQSEKYLYLTFVKKDSLNYIDEHNLNIERLCCEIANRECVHLLVAMKHYADIKEIPENKWRCMICCDNSFIEAITSDDILNEHIESVRINEKDYHLYFDYLYKDFISELADIEKKYRLADFRNMQILLEKQGIKLEVIDENEH